MNANLKIECFKMMTFKIVIFDFIRLQTTILVYKLRVQTAVI
jgi:hypothetical protein